MVAEIDLNLLRKNPENTAETNSSETTTSTEEIASIHTEQTSTTNKATTNPIISPKQDNTLTIDELKNYYEEIKITDKTEDEIRELIASGKISKKDVLEAFRTLKKLSKDMNINIKDIPNEYWQSFIAINLKHKAGTISDEKYAELKEAFSTDNLAKSIKLHLEQNGNSITQEEAEKYQKLYAKLSHINEVIALNGIENDKKLSIEERENKKEVLIEKLLAARTKGHKNRLQKLERLITSKTDAKTASAILKSADAYVIEHQNLTESYLVANNYSETFIDKIKKIGENILDNILDYTKKFISNFWETPKGKAIIKDIEHQYEETKKAKKIAQKLEEKKEEVKTYLEKIKEKIDIAKKKAKIAMAKAAEFLKKLGITPSKLTKAEGRKLIKTCSPEIAYKYKKAYYQELDAKNEELEVEISLKYAEKERIHADEISAMNKIILGNKIEAAMIAASIHCNLSSIKTN